MSSSVYRITATVVRSKFATMRSSIRSKESVGNNHLSEKPGRSSLHGFTKRGITLLKSKTFHRMDFYFDLSARMREVEQSFSKQVDDFLDFYPSYIEHVRPELNGLFREEDYPSADALIDTNVRQSVQKGTEDLWNRLKSVVSHMADRLNEPESRFHAALLTNVFDLVDLLPQLNVGQDQELNRFAAEIRNRLCIYPAHELKKNDIRRVTTARDAAALLDEMDTVIKQRERSTAEVNICLDLVRARTTSSRTCRPI
jgi:hypothetical protein